MVRTVGKWIERLGLATFFASVAWFFFVFTPNISVESKFYVTGNQFLFENWSYKPFLGNQLCAKPSDAIIVFEDEVHNRHRVKDNAKGYGTGDSNVKRWVSTGRPPLGLESGVVRVYKQVIYPCIFGTVKDVRSSIHIWNKP